MRVGGETHVDSDLHYCPSVCHSVGIAENNEITCYPNTDQKEVKTWLRLHRERINKVK